MIKKQILNTIEKYHLIENGAHIVIGLSGGPDSVCLFDVLCQMAPEWNLTLYPVHINHKFRPGAAEADQAYVETLCENRGWPCQSFVYDCNTIAKEQKITSEEAGRNVRYEAFAKAAAAIKERGIQQKNIVIAVAQNADDQAETILFRMLRGAGTDGLSGIGYSRFDEAGNRIVRPLLDCFKKDILAYCAEQNLDPCIDHTNEEAIYTRNKIRLELIPYLEEEYNHKIKDTMIRMGKACASDREFLWQTAKESFEKLVKVQTDHHILLDGPGLQALHRSVRQRVISMALSQIGLTEDVSYTHFECCEEIIFHQSPSARTDLPKGYYLTKNYEDIRVSKSVDGNADEKGKMLRIRCMDIKEYQSLQLPKDSHAAFDADQMEAAYAPLFGKDFTKDIVLAAREAGDTISIGGGKRKKIQDYFVDRKIPKDQRNQIKMVKIGHDVLWIPPYEGKGRFCSNFKLCSDTKKVICIEIICVLC